MQAPPRHLSFGDGATQSLSLAWYAQRRPVFTGGNRVALLRGGDELFPAMVQAIDAAQESVWLANYLTGTGGQADLVFEALARAVRRGVAVQVVMDGVGSREVPEAFWQSLRNQGIQLAIYRPVAGLLSALNSRNWRRMHLKLCVVDEDLGFVGGINLIDDRHDLVHGWTSQPRLDYAVQVQGPTALPVQHTIRAMWTRATLGRDWRDDLIEWMKVPGRMKRLRQVWQQARLRLPPVEQGQISASAGIRLPMRAAFVLRDNLRQRRTIERASLQAIQQARSNVDIVTPYFYPGRALRRALKHAADRGVRVRLLLQGKVDYKIAAIAARALYDELQAHGVCIFEYQPSWLHAKVLCVDDEWATVGSSNLDPLSMLVNLEGNLIVRDRGFAKTLGAALARDFADSAEVPRASDVTQPRSTRWMRGALNWVAKLYLRLAGVRRRDWRD
ncbi:MAG: cardiolipin synthase ClsB [Pseudomonadota bacterium]